MRKDLCRRQKRHPEYLCTLVLSSAIPRDYQDFFPPNVNPNGYFLLSVCHLAVKCICNVDLSSYSFKFSNYSEYVNLNRNAFLPVAQAYLTLLMMFERYGFVGSYLTLIYSNRFITLPRLESHLDNFYVFRV